MISFNVPEAGNFLLKNRIVYSMRRKRSEERSTRVSIMGSFRGRVSIKEEGRVTEFLIATHVGQSGFKTISAWKEVAGKIHGTNIYDLYLYKVEME